MQLVPRCFFSESDLNTYAKLVAEERKHSFRITPNGKIQFWIETKMVKSPWDYAVEQLLYPHVCQENFTVSKSDFSMIHAGHEFEGATLEENKE